MFGYIAWILFSFFYFLLLPQKRRLARQTHGHGRRTLRTLRFPPTGALPGLRPQRSGPLPGQHGDGQARQLSGHGDGQRWAGRSCGAYLCAVVVSVWLIYIRPSHPAVAALLRQGRQAWPRQLERRLRQTHESQVSANRSRLSPAPSCLTERRWTACPAGKEVGTGNQAGRWMETDPGRVRTPVPHVWLLCSETWS